MKTLNEKINENLIVEANAKNVHCPRKGTTIYLLKDGDSKIVKATVTDIKKVKMEKGSRFDSYYIYIYLSKNDYNIENYMEYHFGSIEYNGENEQVHLHAFGDEIGNIYIGTSKEAIQEFINSDGQKKLENILKNIKQKEAELEELMKKKQKYEHDANLEINEALKN
jgi:hypothetical protein